MKTIGNSNRSEVGDWILVHDNVKVIMCTKDNGDGQTRTTKPMEAFTTEQACKDFIEATGLIVEEDLTIE